MARRTSLITVGDRTFTVAGVTLGTARRVPGPLKTATRVLREVGTRDPDDATSSVLAPAAADTDDLIRLIHDGITAAEVDTIDFDALSTLFDDLDIADGVGTIYRAIGVMFESGRPVSSEAKADDSGNSNGSESAT